MTGPTVFVVDDEPGMRKALERLLLAEGFAVRTFASAGVFLSTYQPEMTGCMILDIAMPVMDGLTLQQHLISIKAPLPVIFLTGHGDIPLAVRSIKAGALDFLIKPVNADDLIAAVRLALGVALDQAEEFRCTDQLQRNLNKLTPREREVMEHVISGKLNKQIASVLGTGEQTIKIHRMRMMEKMALKSVAELVRAAERLGVNPAD